MPRWRDWRVNGDPARQLGIAVIKVYLVYQGHTVWTLADLDSSVILVCSGTARPYVCCPHTIRTYAARMDRVHRVHR